MSSSSREIPADVMEQATRLAEQFTACGCPECDDIVEKRADEIARALMEQQARYIPVSEELPEEGVEVLTWVESDREEGGYYALDAIIEGTWDRIAEFEDWAGNCAVGGADVSITVERCRVTHWQPLPPSPVPTTEGE